MLCVEELTAALRLRDLTDPARGPHAMQPLLDDVLAALTGAWECTLDVQRRGPLVSVQANYDRLGYASSDITRDSRYSRYASETVMLRSHTSAGIPAALRTLATQMHDEPDIGTTTGAVDVLLVLPGQVYRRDSIDHVHAVRRSLTQALMPGAQFPTQRPLLPRVAPAGVQAPAPHRAPS